MENNPVIESSNVYKYIHGRINPKIYAFETDTIPKYLKVGDTFRAVDERLNEWKHNGFEDLRKVDDWSAEIPGKDLYFRDYSVHSYLRKIGKDRLTKETFAGKPYSNEFFKNATKEDVEQAIAEIIQKSDCENTEYVYYSVYDRAPQEEHFERDTKEWEPRKPLQTDAIEKFCKARENGRNNLLMYAVMRFGKSFTSLCCAKAMNAKLVLVVSGKADVAVEWQENVERPAQFEDFVFLNTKNLARNDSAISSAQSENKTIILFLTLQDLANEKKRFAELFNQTIDLMIIDETHFAARADMLGKVIRDTKLPADTVLSQQMEKDGIKDESLSSVDPEKAQNMLEKVSKGLTVTAKLHLSGTPYRILLGSEFEPEDRISFCQYSDIIEQKEKWYAENIAGKMQEETKKEEWDNPYYGFPEMIRFAFNLNESAKAKLNQLQEEGYTSRLSALFAPKSVTKSSDGEHKQFIYEKEILDFLLTVDGSKSDENVLGFLDNERIKEGELCHHIVMVLPFCASCDAMEELIKRNETLFKNLEDYEIINISGVETTYDKISAVKNKIADCERGKDSSGKRKTITLTVNRMLTGCTVPEWDTMIFLKDTASPQDYDQAIFRLQSQFVTEYKGIDANGKERIIKKDMKPQTLLVDFDPQRMFYLQETKSRIYNINTIDGGNDESEKRIEKELKISPILHIVDNKLVEVQPNDILKAVSEYSTSRGITEAANDIIVDETLIGVNEIKAIIDREFEIGSGKGFAEQAYLGEETDLGDDDIGTSGTPDDKNNKNDKKTDKTDSHTEKGTETDIKVFVRKCRSYYRRILFYAFLCKSENEIRNLKEVIDSTANSENDRIFHNLGMNKAFIILMHDKMNGNARRSLDDKIYDLYRLSHEYEQDDVDPIKRATTAIKKFGKISDSEVVTPSGIAKDMVDLIPEDGFTNTVANSNFLDIASKMGEFAVAIYNRAIQLGISHDEIKDRIYSIPTSGLAYEFTRYIYEKLGLETKNISQEFNSYDLLKVKIKYTKGKKAGQDTDELDFKKICAILSQSKPFNEITLDDEIAEGDEKVSFDIVAGNPPYQSSRDSTSDAQIFNLFMDVGYELSPIACFITPAKFLFNAGNTPKNWNEKMLSDKYLKVIKYEPEADNIFHDSEIKGGVAITLRNKHEECGAIGEYLANSILQAILRAVKSKDFSPITKVIFLQAKFDLDMLYADYPNMRAEIGSNGTEKRLTTNIFKLPIFSDKKINKTDIKILGLINNVRFERFIEKKYIIDGNLDFYKVVLPEANGTGEFGEVLSSPIIMENQNSFTQSFLGFGSFEHKYEAENMLKYIKTKFARAMLGTKKVTHHAHREVWENVPLQDFSNASDIDWSKSVSEIDIQLYKKYGLTQEEIDFIETTIQPME